MSSILIRTVVAGALFITANVALAQSPHPGHGSPSTLP